MWVKDCSLSIQVPGDISPVGSLRRAKAGTVLAYHLDDLHSIIEYAVGEGATFHFTEIKLVEKIY